MAGIDYGMGRTNINHETGIRFGVISMHDISQAWADSSEGYYGEPTCPKCGDTVCSEADTADYDSDDYAQYEHGCADYVCHECKHTLDSSDVYPEEPIGHSLDVDGVKATDCLDSDVMVLDSPFYTFAPFCSPCVPGAGNLDNAQTPTDGDMRDAWAKAYCFGHEWFEDGKAPYRVFRVVDDVEVFAEEV